MREHLLLLNDICVLKYTVSSNHFLDMDSERFVNNLLLLFLLSFIVHSGCLVFIDQHWGNCLWCKWISILLSVCICPSISMCCLGIIVGNEWNRNKRYQHFVVWGHVSLDIEMNSHKKYYYVAFVHNISLAGWGLDLTTTIWFLRWPLGDTWEAESDRVLS